MDYIEFARTSYFPPKDMSQAKKDAEMMGASLVKKDGVVAFIFCEGVPSFFPEEDWETHPAWDKKKWGIDRDDDHAQFLYDLLQWHIAEKGNGLVLTAIGYEGNRYYDAWAALIPATGDYKIINLQEEIKKACEQMSGITFDI